MRWEWDGREKRKSHEARHDRETGFARLAIIHRPKRCRHQTTLSKIFTGSWRKDPISPGLYRNNLELGDQCLSFLPAASTQPDTYPTLSSCDKGEFW